jgi:hypothetical protein
VRVAGVSVSGRRYARSFTFHTCLPQSDEGGDSGVPYLRPA